MPVGMTSRRLRGCNPCMADVHCLGAHKTTTDVGVRYDVTASTSIDRIIADE
ncbi:hypothetical protein PC117_g20296 [Phytophthora cactorum]|uniref:Uncharacterized protein n=1 Tax=Phytophthora cactorum TaxID=29920 RepID=A0A8T1BR92_9STRA|nr:hypothetical protein PC117_g20296 [Phytophthora cactorum]